MDTNFSRRQVERSFRKFKDTVDDLMSASFNTWGETFSHLITHCEEDPVMHAVTEPLRNNPNVNAQKWYSDCLASVQGMVGTARYELPYNDDDRTALLYQFFLRLEEGAVEFRNFCMYVYGHTRYQEMTDTFNQELVVKFTREVSYRLDEIMEDFGDEQEIPRAAMVVFHHHDYSTNIQGNIHGSNVAGGAASQSHAQASYLTTEQLTGALLELRPLIADVSAQHRQSVTDSLELLIKSATDQGVAKEDVIKAAELIVSASPTMAQRLRSIATSIGTSLLASTIFQGLKVALGIP
jgi:hypothetical protein